MNAHWVPVLILGLVLLSVSNGLLWGVVGGSYGWSEAFTITVSVTTGALWASAYLLVMSRILR